MGFVDALPDERIFTDDDVEVLAAVDALMAQGMADPDLVVQLTRVMGLSLSGEAEAIVEAWRQRRITPLRETGASEPEIDEVIAEQAGYLLSNNERFLAYIWRRHLAAAAKRGALADASALSEGPPLGVGFADLVGFTTTSVRLEERELAELVDRFETTAHDAVTSLGGSSMRTMQ